MRALLILVLCLTPVLAQATPWFKAQGWTLSNGLQVVWLPNHRAPLVHASVWYKAGGADDPAGKSGTAHYLEHLMFRGAVKKGDLGHSQTIKSWGGNDNAFTAMDVTAYFQTVPSGHLDDVLRMEARRMRALTVSEKDAGTEHGVIQQERHQTVESDPGRVFSEIENAIFYPNHPYGRPIIGTPGEIKTLTLDDARAFHKSWYGPDNAILVVAGDVTRDDVEKLSQRHFGSLAPVHPPKRTHLYGVRAIKDTARLRRCDARIAQSELRLSWPMPAPRADQQLALAATLAASMAGGDPASPLYKRLVIEQKLASALDFGYSDSLQGAAYLELALWPAANRDPGAILDAAPKILRETLLALTQEDIDRARAELRLRTTMISDQPIGLAMQIGYNMAMGETLQDMIDWPSDLDAVTLADIRRLAGHIGAARLETALLPEGSCAE